MRGKATIFVCLDAEIASPPTQINMFRIEIVEYSTNIWAGKLKVI
jgi:hypothetical protein